MALNYFFKTSLDIKQAFRFFWQIISTGTLLLVLVGFSVLVAFLHVLHTVFHTLYRLAGNLAGLIAACDKTQGQAKDQDDK